MDGQTRDTWKAMLVAADLVHERSLCSEGPVLQHKACVPALAVSPRIWTAMLLTKLWRRPSCDHRQTHVLMSVIKPPSPSEVLSPKTVPKQCRQANQELPLSSLTASFAHNKVQHTQNSELLR